MERVQYSKAEESTPPHVKSKIILSAENTPSYLFHKGGIKC